MLMLKCGGYRDCMDSMGLREMRAMTYRQARGGFRFIDAFAAQAAHEIEDALRCGNDCETRVRGVKVLFKDKMRG